MNPEALTLVALLLSALPAGMFVWNLFLLRSPSRNWTGEAEGAPASVSVLIPARNEVHRLAAAIESVLANPRVDLELIILDDHSTDATPEIVRGFMAGDPRVRLINAPPLLEGWCGKQHACHVLARHARHSLLVFMDADVRLSPDALARMVAFMRQSGAALASGVPRQVTGTFAELLLIPLVHFVLLGFLPIWRMRRCTQPSYAAGCGQLFIANAQAYHQTGGHSMIRSTLHDGIKLPRLFRQLGYRTDLFNATDVAECRMYEGAREVISGLMKNAHEALAAPAMIVPMTLMLLGGQVLPWILLACWPALSVEARLGSSLAAGLTLLPRLLAAWRFHQPLPGAMLHPFSILLFVGIQWAAFVGWVLGRPTQWRGRDYGSGAKGPVPPSTCKPTAAQQGTS
jgi:hypothetical protein